MAHLEQREFRRMFAGISSEGGEPGTFHYALNLLPQSDGSLIMRPPLGVAGAGPGASNWQNACGVLRKRDGTAVNWRLCVTQTTNLPFIQVLASAGTWSTVVSTANMATAGVTSGLVFGLGAVPWGRYSDSTKDYIVFTNGAQVPFAWDGSSGAASITPLTNAPASNRRPTTYAGKLFFIKRSDERTIVWSEEFLVNTGYEAGGYLNVWTLAQTSTEGLTSILGLNDALYFARPHSIGKITGEVSSTFTTSATQDAVAVGIGSIAELCAAGDAIWFLSTDGQPYSLPLGGVPQPIRWSATEPEDPSGAVFNTGSTRTTEPFGYGAFIWAPPVVPTTAYADILSPLYVPHWRLWHGATVWFPIVDQSASTTTRGVLVCDAKTHEVVCWIQPNTGGTTDDIWSVFQLLDDKASVPVKMDNSSGTCVYMMGMQVTGGAIVPFYSGGDQNSSGTAQSLTYRAISGPLRIPDRGMSVGDITLTLLGKGGSVSGSAGVITSRVNDTSLLTLGSWSKTFSSSYREQQRVYLGWEDEGEWGRVIVSVSSSTLVAFGIRAMAFDASPIPLALLA